MLVKFAYPTHMTIEAMVDESQDLVAEWKRRALCQDRDPEYFFPEPHNLTTTRQARGICRVCDVRIECLEYALDNQENHGVWGGLTVRERKRLARNGN